MVGIGSDQTAQLVGVAKGRERPVHQANDFGELDLLGCSPQTVAAFGAANAFHDARVLQLEEESIRGIFPADRCLSRCPESLSFQFRSGAPGSLSPAVRKGLFAKSSISYPFEVIRILNAACLHASTYSSGHALALQLILFEVHMRAEQINVFRDKRKRAFSGCALY